jgi:hypothetical protein
MLRRLILAWPLLVCAAAGASAQDATPPQAKVSLFDGESLAGWVVTDCEAVVENGVLLIKDGNGLVRTDHRYRDFILEISYKPRRAERYDAGIYIRSELPAEGKPWPPKHQVNLKQGDEANLIGFRDARSRGLVKEGQWNQLKLTVVQNAAQMEINGQMAWKTGGLKERDGYIGIQVEVPGGGQYEFKDIAITEIGYQPLFNGKDLAGWEGAGQDAAQCWKVENGLLVCTGEKGPWLRSSKQFGDFNLRLAYKLKAGGNSGVYIRVPADGNHHGTGAGIEVQLLDDKADRYKTLMPYQYTGSLYAIVPAEPRVSKGPDVWQTIEIDCRGKHYLIYHNGAKVIDADAEAHPELANRLVEGYLGLQNHSEEVWFRDIRLGPSVQGERETSASR